ncbi:hypothetical protein ACFVMC_08510 [Nocardia sp. NPDC127579]|uniref:hypothetical protein n=1 Tax=Nocardia sp. NPDC127579 TaxID=3345402 RepID=UPI00363EA67E
MSFIRCCAAVSIALVAPLPVHAAVQAAPAPVDRVQLPAGLWEVPTAAPESFDLIIAYAFGNRIPAGVDPARTVGSAWAGERGAGAGGRADARWP